MQVSFVLGGGAKARLVENEEPGVYSEEKKNASVKFNNQK